MELKKIADGVLQRPGLAEKVAAIVSAATTESGISTQALWHSLVYSGVVLGVEELQYVLFSMTNDQLQAHRDMISKLSVLLQSTADMENITQINEILEMSRRALADRARTLAALHTQHAKNQFGLEDRLLTTPVSKIPATQLRAAGFIAYQKATGYFLDWFEQLVAGTLPNLKCRCRECLSLIPRRTHHTEDMLIAYVMEHFGSLDDAFQEFAEFLLEEYSIQLARHMESAGDSHPSTPKDMAEMVSSVMKTISRAGGTE